MGKVFPKIKDLRKILNITFILLITYPIFASAALAETNLVLNPSFENGTTTPLNWIFVTQNANTPVWDTISYTGSKSVKISISGTINRISGYPKSGLITVQSLTTYVVSAWGKTSGIGGSNTPAVRVVELDANKIFLKQTNLPVFGRGTNGWTQKTSEFTTGSASKYIYVYANIWNGYGTFWMDDVTVSLKNPPTPASTATPAPTPASTLTPPPTSNVLNGWRSSAYGYQTAASPNYWVNVARAIAAKHGGQPAGIWLVGETDGDPTTGTLLYMPSSSSYSNIRFEGGDIAEPYLAAFDKYGIKVILQVEPMNADINTLIDIIMNRYKNHSSVIGFGVDNEWYKTCTDGCKTTAAEVTAWNNKLHSINPDYVLMIKHFDPAKLPTGIPTDVLVVSDDEQNGDINTIVAEHKEMAGIYLNNRFGAQIGYPSDKNIWGNMDDPVKTLGDAVESGIRRDISIFWVDFSISQVFPKAKYDITP